MWATHFNYRKPIEDLIPELKQKSQQEKQNSEHFLIDREINRLIPIVRFYLGLARIETVIETTSEEGKKKRFHMIRDYLGSIYLKNPHADFPICWHRNV